MDPSLITAAFAGAISYLATSFWLQHRRQAAWDRQIERIEQRQRDFEEMLWSHRVNHERAMNGVHAIIRDIAKRK